MIVYIINNSNPFFKLTKRPGHLRVSFRILAKGVKMRYNRAMWYDPPGSKLRDLCDQEHIVKVGPYCVTTNKLSDCMG